MGLQVRDVPRDGMMGPGRFASSSRDRRNLTSLTSCWSCFEWLKDHGPNGECPMPADSPDSSECHSIGGDAA